MQGEIEKAATPAAALKQQSLRTSYSDLASASNQNLREQIGLVLLVLQSPMKRAQRKKGHGLLRALLVQRWSVVGEIQ